MQEQSLRKVPGAGDREKEEGVVLGDHCQRAMGGMAGALGGAMLGRV